MADQTPVRLFISHHSSKHAVALEVEALLAARGIRCWIAPRDVPPGAPFDTAISEAIESSAAILLLFCSNSDKSRHVKRELILGDSAGRPIIPLRLEAIDPGELAYHLADSQWIDWIDRRETVMDRLAAQARLYAGVPAELADDVTTLGAEALGEMVADAEAGSETKRNWTVPALVFALIAALLTIVVIMMQPDSAETGALTDTEQVADLEAPETPPEDGPEAQPTPLTPSPTPTSAVARPTDLVAVPVNPTPSPTPTSGRTLLIDPALASRAEAELSINRVIDACRGAATDTEYLICADPEFSDRAQVIGMLIDDIRSFLAETDTDPTPFNRDQRAWFNGVKARCRTAECVESAQRDRISHLTNIKTQFIVQRAQENQ